jgi:antitoxin (DNA-binding transcriptional repressor) of toxin-antitoxin stability system
VGERVRKTGEPVLITRFGHPIAEIVAPGALEPTRRLSTMAGSGRIIGDIVGPIGDESVKNERRHECAEDAKSTADRKKINRLRYFCNAARSASTSSLCFSGFTSVYTF